MKKISVLIGVIISLFFYDVTLAQCVTCDNSTATGENSSVIGINNQANAINSKIIGMNSITNGWHSIVIGNFSTTASTGINSITIGMHTSAVAGQSMVIGLGNSAAHVLSNTYQQSLMVGFNSDLPTFFVSRSAGYGKTGQVVIGNRLALPNGPQAKLHIKADEGEDASLFLEPHNFDNGEAASLLLGNMRMGIGADKTFGLVFNSDGKPYLFNEGNVGIGTTEYLPETKLDVNGTVKMTGLRLMNETTHTGYILSCSGINGQAVWEDPSAFSLWDVNDGGDIYRMSRVGILTSEPKTELDVNGNIGVNDAVVGKITTNRGEWVDPDYLNLVGSTNENASKIMIPKGNDSSLLALKIINPALGGEIQFFAGTNPNAVLRKNEFIVGFPNNNVDIKVNGKIWSHEVEVKLTDWWDEVLTKDYKLMPLHQLERYIITNKHLPDIPTEKEVLKNGIELGEMNALLLKKVEELTLYVIEQQKRIEKLEKKIGKSN